VRLVAAGFFLMGLVVGAGALALGPYAVFRAADRILPGVTYSGLPLGGMSAEQAAAFLDQHSSTAQPITLHDGVRSWQAAPDTLGLRLDSAAAASRAYAYGREARLLEGSLLMYTALQEGWQPPASASFDRESAREGLLLMAGEVYIAPIDASLGLENGTLVERPSVQGFSLDVEQTLDWLEQNALAALEYGQAPLFLSAEQAAVVDISSARAEAELLLAARVQISAYDPVRNETLSDILPPEVMLAMLTVEASPQGPQVSLQTLPLWSYLQAWSDSLGADRWIDFASLTDPALQPAVRQGEGLHFRVRHSPTTYTVQSGDTLLRIAWRVGIPSWMIIQANPGMDSEVLYPGQVLAVPSKDDMLPLPVVPNKRIVISIQEQRMRVFQDGGLLWEHVISTGMDRSPTQPGVFQVQTHYVSAYASVWDLTMPHFIGIYEAWPGFMNGIHGLPTLSNGQRLWASALGRPSSYGCIILGLQEAEQLFSWAEPGVVVEILP
jgi:LysM repeat protein